MPIQRDLKDGDIVELAEGRRRPEGLPGGGRLWGVARLGAGQEHHYYFHPHGCP